MNNKTLKLSFFVEFSENNTKGVRCSVLVDKSALQTLLTRAWLFNLRYKLHHRLIDHTMI